MKALSYFILFVFALGVVACPADDETVVETVIEKEIQCSDGETIVTDPADCPAPERETTPPPPPTTPEPEEPEEPTADSGDCNLFAKGKAELIGSSNDDVICGDDDNNTVKAGGGEDIVRGMGGDDKLHGEKNNDELYGGAGDDTLDGGEGDDDLYGEEGDDILTGGDGDDVLNGGPGSDTVKYAGVDADGDAVTLTIDLANGFSDDEYGDTDDYIDIENVEIEGISGTAYTITGDDGPNILTGGDGDDTINGGAGNDTIDGGGGTTNTLDGGEGTDTLIVGISSTGPLGDNFENLRVRTGTDATTRVDLQGNDGPNVLTGHDGSNTLTGNAGDDTLYGEDGSDVLIGGPGKDTLIGGPGVDCFVLAVEDPVAIDTVRDFDGDSVYIALVPDDTTTTGTEKAIAESNRVVICVDEDDGQGGSPDGKCDSGSAKVPIANISGLPAGTDITTTDCQS